jgi:hypothetical protein
MRTLRLLVVFLLFGLPAAAQTLYYGATCRGASSNTPCDIWNQTQTGVQGDVLFQKYILGSAASGFTVSAVGAYFNAADGTNPQFQVAIYTDSSGVPGTLLCNSAADASIGTVPGWSEGTLSGCGTLSANTPYWVAFQPKGAGTNVAKGGSGGQFKANTYGVWPASMSATSAASDYSSYLKLTGTLTAQTWYIRTNGGTRYDTTFNSSGQCNGLADADYVSGTNQACAYNDVRYLWADGTAGGNWAISAGDTVIVRGGPWRIGAINNTGADFNAYKGIHGNTAPFGDFNPTIPSGTSGQHTRLLGENFANCATKTQLHGGFGTTTDLNIGAAAFVDIECLELTKQSNCQKLGVPVTTSNCSTSNPYDDYSDNGILTDANSHDILLQDLNVHGLTKSGIQGPIGANFKLVRDRFAFNAMAGWNPDNGLSFPANQNGANASMDNEYVTMEWNGCNEEYPIVDAIPAQSCYDTNDGGFGDAFSGQDSFLISFICNHCIIRYNTKDCLTSQHVYVTTETITNSLFHSNMGECLKFDSGVNGAALIQNNVIISDCMRLAAPITGAPSGYNTHLSGFCRADGATWTTWWPVNGSFEADNNTFVAASTNVGFDVLCTDKVNSVTSIANGGSGYMTGDVVQFFTNYQGSSATVTASGGVIQSLSLTAGGAYFALPSNPVALIGGSGTGGTANVTFTTNSCNGGNRILRNNIFLGYTNPNNPGYNSTTIAAFCYSACNGQLGTVDDTMWTTRTKNVWFGFAAGSGNCSYVGEICNSDPLFVNEPLQTWTSNSQLDPFNFSITSSSPAKYAGVAIGGLTNDYNGLPWHSPPSVGALEFVTGGGTGLVPGRQPRL